ncbi:MAG: hydantoinase/oxoprolinase N-terminal domain-containing protein, partial [Paracoccaceae bacterium]
MSGFLRIGVDVGGTNTDAALLRGTAILATTKRPTTANINDGVVDAISSVLGQAGVDGGDVGAVMIGTTHFLNAVIERQRLQKVGVLRLCGQSTLALPPMIDWPDDLRRTVSAGSALVGGGVEFDGQPIAPLDEAAVRQHCAIWRDQGVTAIAICSVFALVSADMELAAGRIVEAEIPGANVSLSHRIGHTG